MTEVAKFSTEIDQTNEKNRNCVHCQFCNSIMLKAQCASYVENEVFIPKHIEISDNTLRLRHI